MKDLTSEKILRQVMDIFREPITPHDALVFSLQLLCWAKISRDDQMPADLKIQARSFADRGWVRTVWDYLVRRPGIVGVAYSGGNLPAKLDPSRLGAAVELCLHLTETGVLDNFNPSDSILPILGRGAMEYCLPVELANAMTALADVKAGTSVYVPWDNSAQLATRATIQGASAYIETMFDPMLPALLSMFATGDIEIAHSDPVREPSAVIGGKLRQFDACVAFPPLGLRYTSEVTDRDWYNRFRDRGGSGTVLAIRHIIAQTSGRAVIAVSYSLLFSPGGELALREDLLKLGFIEAVISMPSGLLANTTVSFALIVLNMKAPGKTVRFINADVDRFREPIPRSRARARLIDIEGIVARVTGKVSDDLVAEVSNERIIHNGCILQVNRYVLPASQHKIQTFLEQNQTRVLEDIATIIRPMPLIPSDDALNAFEVMTSDIPEMGYIPAPTKEVLVDKGNATRKQLFLYPYDVLLVFKGSVGKVGIVPVNVPEPGEGGWIAGQSAVVLRVNNPKDVDSRALAVYLRSDLGQMLLTSISVQGATIPMIQLKELKKLPIIVPPLSKACEIGDILDEQARIQAEIEDLRARQIQLAKQIWTVENG